MVERHTAARDERTPLDLARALLRYGRMADPCRAYERLHDEWPPAVARMLEKVLWTEVKLAHRTVAEVAAELHALNRKAEAQANAVKALMASRKLPLAEAVETVFGGSRRCRRVGRRA